MPQSRERNLFGKLPVWVRALALAGAAALAAALVARVGVVSDLLLAFERKSLDYRVARYRGGAFQGGTVPSEVVIVAIDEASLVRLGRFSLWPRSYHARLLDRLAAAGVRTVAFDVLFSESDNLPDAVRGVRAREIAANTDADSATADHLLRGAGGDARFARALSEFGNAWLALDPSSGAEPLPELVAAAAGIGHVSMAPDPDGILRRVRLTTAGEGVLPLALAATLGYLDQGKEGGPEYSTETGEIALDFIGGRGSFLTLSYADVLEGKVDDVLLRDRLVLVGSSAAGLGDQFATPFSEDLPGVEAHATLAYQVMQGRSIHGVGGWDRAMPLLLAVPTSLAILWLGPAWAGGASVLLAAGYLVSSFEAFAQRGLQLPFALPLFTWMVAALLAGAYRFGSEERGRREIRRAFGRYVSPEVVDELTRRPELLRVGGEAREITVGFVDIRGFTTLSESMDPERLARFLHAFFSAVEAEIHACRGTVDKYIGDAVMMVFGAPNALPDAASQACQAALAIQDAVEAGTELWSDLGVPSLRIGVGLETGVAVVGNIGSERRFDYTALGDTVNVAARLQDMNKTLGTTILLGPGTAKQVGDRFALLDRGSHSLRGRPGPLWVNELVGTKSDKELHDVVQHTQEGSA
jgi:adenylate cyclase